MSRRPLGLDPDAVEEVSLDGGGVVRFGFVPWGKWEAIRARYLRALNDAAVRNKGRALAWDLAPETQSYMLLHLDPEYRVELAETNRDMVRWTVRGWVLDGVPDAQTEVAEYQGRKYTALTQRSLDVLEMTRRVDEMAGAALTFWSLTAAEKKSSTTSASTDGTAEPAATATSSAETTAATSPCPKAEGAK